jgi:hypothetical protein
MPAPVIGPTLAGFSSFIYQVMGISPIILPVNSVYIGYAYGVAAQIVNQALSAAGGSIYALATYNLAGSLLLNFAQDAAGRQTDPSSFTQLRTNLGIANWTPGVVASSADTGTSEVLLNPEFMKTLTLQNLQQLKDPYGRQYLAFAQTYGPTIWGLS